MEEKTISILVGVVCFFLGLMLMGWSNKNSTGEELAEPFRNAYDDYGYGSMPSMSFLSLVGGFILLCAGSIAVGGVLLGWDTSHILNEAFNCCSSIADWVL